MLGSENVTVALTPGYMGTISVSSRQDKMSAREINVPLRERAMGAKQRIDKYPCQGNQDIDKASRRSRQDKFTNENDISILHHSFKRSERSRVARERLTQRRFRQVLLVQPNKLLWRNSRTLVIDNRVFQAAVSPLPSISCFKTNGMLKYCRHSPKKGTYP